MEHQLEHQFIALVNTKFCLTTKNRSVHGLILTDGETFLPFVSVSKGLQSDSQLIGLRKAYKLFGDDVEYFNSYLPSVRKFRSENDSVKIRWLNKSPITKLIKNIIRLNYDSYDEEKYHEGFVMLENFNVITKIHKRNICEFLTSISHIQHIFK